MPDIFQVNQLSYQYKDTDVLRNISLGIPKGKITGILGPNGSGKTTLLKLLSGIIKPTQGEVLLEGYALSRYSRKERARKIAFLEQNTSVSLPFTVEKVVELGRYPWLKPLASLSDQDKEVIRAALVCFDLYDKKDKTMDNLSGGEKQLVSLARAMAQEPQILFLDEPTTYLDVGHQSMVMEYLLKWHKNSENTIIMVIHDLNLSSLYCENLIIMDQGKFLISGTPSEVLDQDRITHLYKAQFSVVKHPTSGVPQFLPHTEMV